MEKYVLDTSVMLLAFSRNGGGKLHHLLEKVVAGKAELYFPRFLQYEIRNTFAKLGCDLQQISEYTESILFMEHVGLVKCIEENEALHQIALGFVQMESE